jgi:dolichyl-phosphate beta-glucosyltransferase
MQLIIPALNEERRLPSTLRALRAYVLAASEGVGPVEVIVVDNASTDATAAVARSFDSSAMTVRVVSCAKRGKGAAVRAGIAETDADIVAFMDADGATELPALVAAVALIDGGADVAVASRALPASITWERHSRVRSTGAALYRRLTRAVVPSVVDTQCGFKVFRGDLARSVFSETTSTGFSFDVEVLARSAARGADMVEFPVMWLDVPGSTFVPSRHGATSFVELLAIALRMRRLRRSEPDQRVLRLPLKEPVPAPSAIPLAAES